MLLWLCAIVYHAQWLKVKILKGAMRMMEKIKKLARVSGLFAMMALCIYAQPDNSAKNIYDDNNNIIIIEDIPLRRDVLATCKGADTFVTGMDTESE